MHGAGALSLETAESGENCGGLGEAGERVEQATEQECQII